MTDVVQVTKSDHRSKAAVITQKWPSRFATATLICIIFLSLFKDESTVTSSNLSWRELATNPYIALLKSYSVVALFAAATFGLISLPPIRRLSLQVPPLSRLIVLVSLLSAFRAFAGDEEGNLKTATSFILVVGLVGYMSILLCTFGTANYRRILIYAMITASVIFIVSNAINYFTGFGYAPGNPRLFGTAVHPNFMGVQLALSSQLMLAGLILNTRWISRAALLIFMGLGIFLLIQTGSRTGALMFAVGLLIFFWAKKKFSLDRILLLFFAIVAVIMVFVFFGPENLNNSSYDRGIGSGDTRSEAIEFLLNRISNSPFFGDGYFAGASENSYLRGWAAYGISYAIAFTFTVFMMLYVSARQARRTGALDSALFASLIFSLAAGAILEGYLVDNFSYPLLIWLLSSSAYPPVSSNITQRKQ